MRKYRKRTHSVLGISLKIELVAYTPEICPQQEFLLKGTIIFYYFYHYSRDCLDLQEKMVFRHVFFFCLIYLQIFESLVCMSSPRIRHTFPPCFTIKSHNNKNNHIILSSSLGTHVVYVSVILKIV